MRVVVRDQRGGDFAIVAELKEDAWDLDLHQTHAVDFAIDIKSMPTTAVANRAEGGGGGFVYWKGSRSKLDSIELSNNVADYGDIEATPGVTTKLEADEQVITSGEPILEPILVSLYDALDQLVTTSLGSFAIIRTQDATVTNNVVEFSRGRALFKTLVINAPPGSLVNATIEVPQGSLRYSFHVRPCFENEVITESTCAVCPAGKYLDSDSSCASCPDGFDCDEPGSNLASLALDRGYYRQTKKSIVAYKCLLRGACIGGSNVRHDVCADQYTGIRCAACRRGFFQKITGHCKRCDRETKRSSRIAYVTLGAIVGLGLLFFILSDAGAKLSSMFSYFVDGAGGSEIVEAMANYKSAGDDEEYDDRMGNTAMSRFIIKLKAILSFLQIVSTLPVIIVDINWPHTIAFALAIIRSVNLDLASYLNTQCLFEVSSASYFEKRLVATTASPLGIILVLFTIFSFKTRFRPKMDHRRIRMAYTECSLFVIHLILPIASVVSFLALACESIDLGDGKTEQFLWISPTTSCESRRWRLFVAPYAFVSVATWPLGIPLMYSLALFRYRNVLTGKRGTSLHINFETSLTTEVTRSTIGRSPSLKKLLRRSSLNQRHLNTSRKSFIDDTHHDVLAIRFLWIDYCPRCSLLPISCQIDHSPGAITSKSLKQSVAFV